MTERTVYTRKQYIQGDCTHREYYAQFITDEILVLVREGIGMEMILKSKQNEEHFNDIPLRVWDVLGNFIHTEQLRYKFARANDFVSKAGLVCILKQAAFEIAENETEKIRENLKGLL